MASMREIRGRIRSVKSTRQITRAMKMVAAAKLRRAQGGAAGLRAFAGECRRVMACLPAHTGHPLLTARHSIGAVTYVLFVGNRGLCGTYNQAVLHFLQELLSEREEAVSLVVVGRWGTELMEGAGLPVQRRFADFDDVASERDAITLSAYLKELYLSGATDEVYLVYQHFRSALRQEPDVEQLLPLEGEGAAEEGEEYLLEPSAEAVIRRVVELAVTGEVFAAMQEARLGEQAARMTAMSAATDATDELIEKLSLELNRARQAAITTEISEIVGGANALRRMEEEE